MGFSLRLYTASPAITVLMEGFNDIDLICNAGLVDTFSELLTHIHEIKNEFEYFNLEPLGDPERSVWIVKKEDLRDIITYHIGVVNEYNIQLHSDLISQKHLISKEHRESVRVKLFIDSLLIPVDDDYLIDDDSPMVYNGRTCQGLIYNLIILYKTFDWESSSMFLLGG